MNLKGIKLTWLGRATFRIGTAGGKTVLVDPWVMGNPICPNGTAGSRAPSQKTWSGLSMNSL